MRQLFFLVVFVFLINNLSAQKSNHFFEQSNTFFSAYVKNGLVHYKSIHETPEFLDALLLEASQMDIEKMDDNTYKAFAINVYNLAVIKSLVDAYPSSSPMKVKGFFTKKSIHLGGQKYSLNTLEKENIFKKFDDPRLHFALVCGAIGCPKLLSSAYFPSRLDQQLDGAVYAAINDKKIVNWDSRTKKNRLFKIFEWYVDDFGGKKGVMDFINQYIETPLNKDYKIVFLPYNWKINEDTSTFVRKHPTYSVYSEKPVKKGIEAVIENEEVTPVDPVKEGAKEFVSDEEIVVEPITNKEMDNAVSSVAPVENADAFSDDHENDIEERYSASTLYKRGEFEAKLFTGIYAQKNLDGFSDFNSRSTYLNSFVQTLYGINSTINVGVDAWFRSTIARDDIDNSLFKTLKFGNNAEDFILKDNGDTLRYNSGGGFVPFTSSAGLSHLAPKVKIAPFKSAPDFSIQETFYMPVNKNQGNTYISVTDIFYAKAFGEEHQLFLQLSYWADFTKNKATDEVSTNVNQYYKAFYSFFPTPTSTVYATGSIPYRFGKDGNDGGIDYYEFGLGGKYLITDRFEVELLYTHFILNNSDNKANTFNLGFRYSIQN